jgi:DNA-binding transcriptional MerR regulator
MANETARVFSASELDRKAGLSAAERRTLVRVGLLKPARTGGGWAVFSQADLDAAKQWKNGRRGR